MAPKIDPNEIKVGIHVIGGTTEESGFGNEVRGTEVGRSMGTTFHCCHGAGRSTVLVMDVRKRLGEVERGLNGDGRNFAAAVYACVCACVRVDKDQEERGARSIESGNSIMDMD
jgi:hypothetical protein